MWPQRLQRAFNRSGVRSLRVSWPDAVGSEMFCLWVHDVVKALVQEFARLKSAEDPFALPQRSPFRWE